MRIFKKILKNTTNAAVFITDVGQEISALGELEISASDFDKYAQSTETFDFISDATLVVNDGLYDLSIDDGLDWIRGNFTLNYGHSKIETRKYIEFDQQMVVLDEIQISNTDPEGGLYIIGELVVL